MWLSYRHGSRIKSSRNSAFRVQTLGFFFWLRRVSQCSPGCSVDQACLCFLHSGIKVMCDHHPAKPIFSKHAFTYWVFLLCGHVTAHMRLENNRLSGLEAGVHLYSPPRAQALGNTAFLRYGQ